MKIIINIVIFLAFIGIVSATHMSSRLRHKLRVKHYLRNKRYVDLQVSQEYLDKHAIHLHKKAQAIDPLEQKIADDEVAIARDVKDLYNQPYVRVEMSNPDDEEKSHQEAEERELRAHTPQFHLGLHTEETISDNMI